jgi:hypothetical protein
VTWTQQRQLVDSLSGQALEQKHAVRRIRGNLKAWTTNYLASPETLAWIFASGCLWASGRSPTQESGSKGRSMVAVINSSWLVWQLANRQFKLLPLRTDTPA